MTSDDTTERWYPAMNKWSDQTGIAHLISPKSVTVRPLCGARPYGIGGGFPTAGEAGCQPCPNCLRIQARQKKRGTK
jgi:hypothetical protein